MTLRKTMKRLRISEGGTIKFKDCFRRKTFYFDLNYDFSKMIFKRTKKKEDFILLLSSNENHKLFDSLEDVKYHLKISENYKVGSIFKLNFTYALADKKISLELLKDIQIPDNLESYLTDDNDVFIGNTDEYKDENEYPKKEKASYSIFDRKKVVKKERFDWHDAYLEGLRIHGNIDDAESHADDEEYKHKKKYK